MAEKPHSIHIRKFHSKSDSTKSGPVKDKGGDNVLSVLTYNVLADCHVPRWDYSYTKADPKTLELEYRHNILMKEIVCLDSDIVCLQEVGPKYFVDVLQPEMSKLGLEGVFVKKSGDFYDEGCATFYKTSVFTLNESKTFHLGQAANEVIESSSMQLNVDLKSRYTGRDEMVLLLKLKSKANGNALVVVNTHLVWVSSGHTDVRALQAMCSKQFVCTYHKTNPSAMILCGDFNSYPTDPAYGLLQGNAFDDSMMTSLQKSSELPEKDLKVFEKVMKCIPNDPLKMTSAYKDIMGSEPYVTHFDSSDPINGTQLTLDYIFFSEIDNVRLNPIGTLEVPGPDAWEKYKPPNQEFPSDHLPIFSTFIFK